MAEHEKSKTVYRVTQIKTPRSKFAESWESFGILPWFLVHDILGKFDTTRCRLQPATSKAGDSEPCWLLQSMWDRGTHGHLWLSWSMWSEGERTGGHTTLVCHYRTISKVMAYFPVTYNFSNWPETLQKLQLLVDHYLPISISAQKL